MLCSIALKKILTSYNKDLNLLFYNTPHYTLKRNKDVNAKEYAKKVKLQIDSLISLGGAPNLITVIGTSKGGYIAQYVSTFAANPDLNFIFIGAFMDMDIERMPDINYCGNILTIYEETDPF